MKKHAPLAVIFSLTFTITFSYSALAVEVPKNSQDDSTDKTGVVYTGRSDQFHGYSPDGYELHLLTSTPTPQTQTLDSELGNVNIKWIPQSYTYNFGDGTQLQTQDPGSPYPNQTVTHPYNKTGIYYPTLTTTWDAEVTLNNITLRFNGTHQTQSPPLKLEILKAHQDLTALEN